MADAPNIETIRKPLMRRYLVTLTPAAVLLAAWAACRQAGLVRPLGAEYTTVIGPAVFIAAIILAVALPLLYRVLFVKSVEGRPGVSAETFLPFQCNLMSLALLASYAATAGYMAGVANFHFGGAFLAGLYGAYYYFPSRRRVAQELRLFRVDREGAR
ncbi:MAG: hypothetical protein H0S80_04460 [Desulfovibrionaceae bacterium]|nr:hypothetical protein [Desulfovibrionaceae bacterium]